MNSPQNRTTRPYLYSTIMVTIALGVGLTIDSLVDIPNISLVLLVAVLGTAMIYGLLPSLYATFLGVAAYNFFFLPPIYTFTIADPANVVALVVFGLVAVLTSHLAAISRNRLDAARRHARADAAQAHGAVDGRACRGGRPRRRARHRGLRRRRRGRARQLGGPSPVPGPGSGRRLRVGPTTDIFVAVPACLPCGSHLSYPLLTCGGEAFSLLLCSMHAELLLMWEATAPAAIDHCRCS